MRTVLGNLKEILTSELLRYTPCKCLCSTPGDVSTLGNYMSTVGNTMSTPGGVQYTGDIMSTVRDVQYTGGIP